MRVFYIFRINKEFKTITRDRPYNLYLALDSIHSMRKKEVKLAYKLYSEICDPQDKTQINLIKGEYDNNILI